MLQTPGRAFEISSRRAQEAARAAVQAHMDAVKMEQEEAAPASSVALYTWGGLALMCCFAAAITAVLPLALSPSQFAEERAPRLEDYARENPVQRVTDDVAALPSRRDTSDPNTQLALEHSSVPESTKPLPKQFQMKPGTHSAEHTATVVPNTATASTEDPAKEPVDTDLGAHIVLPKTDASVQDVFNSLQRRAPSLFEGLRAQSYTRPGMPKVIAVGPFGDASAQAKFCRTVRLTLTLECEPAKFGEG